MGWPAPTLARVYAGYHTPGASDLAATAVQTVLWPLLFGTQSPLWLRRALGRAIGWHLMITAVR